MAPLPARAEPMSDGGSASGITYLRRGENCWAAAASGERSENTREKQACGHQGRCPSLELGLSVSPILCWACGHVKMLENDSLLALACWGGFSGWGGG